MKKTVLLIYALFIALAPNWGNDHKDNKSSSLLRSLKIADAYALGIDQTADFRLKWNAHKESIFEKEIEKNKKITPLFVGSFTDIPEKKMLIQQLFIPIPQRSTSSQVRVIEAHMDSIYSLFLSEPSIAHFKYLVDQYSSDKNEYWIVNTDETVEFQQAISDLKIGSISLPFLTPRGIHLVYKEDEQAITTRKYYMPQTSLENTLSAMGININFSAKQELFREGQTSQTLVTSTNQKVDLEDYKRFALGNPAYGTQHLWEEFLKSVLFKELKYELLKDQSFSERLDEAYENELINSVYQKRVVNIVKEDSLRVEEYFFKTKSKYDWEKPVFEGIVLFCKNKKIRNVLDEEFKKAPLSEWESIIRLFNKNSMLVEYEMGSFEKGENGTIDAFVFKEGKKKHYKRKGFSKVRVYGDVLTGPKTYKEVRPLVESDYIHYLEQEWEKELMKRYKTGNLLLNTLKTVNNQASN